MAELKTKGNEDNGHSFLNSVEKEKERPDSFTILELMAKATGEEPKMWGDSILGFERYDELMNGLGKYKTGKSCLYLNKLDVIDVATLEGVIKQSVDHMQEISS